MLKIKFLIASFLLFLLSNAMNAQFLKNQIAQARVKGAKEEKDKAMKDLFESKNIVYPPKQLFFRTFKKENLFEVWAKEDKTNQFVLIKTYNVCYMSGTLGPKRKRGDLQVPEGFYYIDYYNPWSSYHLSVRINYPNQSDRILSPYKSNLGSDICIHGSCVSIGCISIEDENIKEVYWLMVQAHGAGQAKIPVHIFPSKMNSASFQTLKEEYQNEKEILSLWENLQAGYQYFEENKKLPTIAVDAKGKYIFK
jgi:murein L,D-transpeptidase YafK